MIWNEKTVRVFISSTFKDMISERDYLVCVVFPELREKLYQIGLEFFDVDLRWGVPASDVNQERANSWEYCKRWIDRSEPFFISLIGQRYGWIPEPSDITDEDDDRRIFQGKSITEMEIRHAVLSGRRSKRGFFYVRDVDVPPVSNVSLVYFPHL